MKTARDRSSHTSSTDRNTLIGVSLVLLILSAVLLANSMTKPVSRDEHMYCTAGVLLARGQLIYRDFAYPSQLPYHPLLLATLYRALGTSHYLLVARLVSVVCEILILISIVGIYRSVFARRRQAGLAFGAAGAILYTFNPLVDYATGYAWNHGVVILCVIVSFWLLITTDFEHKSRYARLALMGGLLTFATCMRVTTALVAVFFMVVVFVVAGGPIRNRMQVIASFCIAGLVVAAWPIWVAVRAGEAFWLNLVRIPALYGHWLQEQGFVHSKAALTLAAFTTSGYLALLALAAYLAWTLFRRRSGLKTETKTMAVAAALLPIIFLVIAYIPPTMWRQYLAIPVPFIVIALAYPLAELRRNTEKVKNNRPFPLAGAVVGLCVAVTVHANHVALSGSLAVLAPGLWTPIELHDMSESIARETREPKRVLTLGPLYALEGGCDIYPELASGSIVYRAADSLSAQEREITRTVSPGTLNELIEPSPPSAVILGIEPSYFASLEAPLRQAIGADWHRSTPARGLLVYTQP